ncbi:hypothetical protein ACFOEK_10605 [Litoribrevibacter euphylliae]|uniref:Uncharacterized protein n=1 Tax=Litoribrevibacter euphylliae TaxID=1834034 RepID=A0ABV7HIE9_9GAMM
MFRRFKLKAFDVYRDGGSLSVSYHDSKGVLNVLMFPIRRLPYDEGSTRLYMEPNLTKYIKKTVISPLTGKPRIETDLDESQISWNQAKRLLSKLRPQVRKIDSNYKWVFDEMCIIASSDNHEI